VIIGFRRFAGVVAALLTALSFESQALAADAGAQATELEYKCAAAKPVDKAMRCYTPNYDLVVVFSLFTPRKFDGPKAVRAWQQNSFDNFENVKVRLESPPVETDGKPTLATYVEHLTATDQSQREVDGRA
jgi:hypothetical protein